MNASDNQTIFEGPIRPTMIKLALPMLAGMLVNLLYNIIDAMWINLIDKNDPSWFGGTGLIFPLMFIIGALASGLMTGISSLVARSIGEGNQDVLDRTAESGMAVAVLLSIITIPLAYIFGADIISMLGATGDLYKHALDYLYFITPNVLFMIILHMLAGILQGEGNVRPIMFAMILGTGLNIILDPIFIFVLNLDIRGAALATVIAQATSTLYIISVFLKNKSRIRIHWKLSNISLPIIKQIGYLGVPQALGQIFMSLAMMILNRIIIHVDQVALTSFTLVGRFDMFLLMPVFALSAAAVTMIGQNAGRGNLLRVKKIWEQGIILGVIVLTVIATLMIIVAPYIYPLFSNVDKVVHYAVMQVRVLEYSFVCAVIGIIGRAFFQAIGYPLPAMFLTLLRTLLISVPVSAFLVFRMNMGIPGIFIGMVSGNVISAVISFFYCRYTIKGLLDGRLKVLKTES